jgi:hypothetical protein
MDDSQIRGLIIKSLYSIRSEGRVVLTPERLALPISSENLLRVANQLLQHGLIEGKFVVNHGLSKGEFLHAMGKLTAEGVDVAEGITFEKLRIEFMTTINNISGSSNVVVGNSNQQNIGNSFTEITQLINTSNFSVAEKEEAKSRLKSFLEHPVAGAVLGAVASAAISNLF